MYLIPIAWMYVVLMVALVEATSANGTWLGALFTVVFWGVLPLSVLMYVLGTPMRRRARRAAASAQAVAGSQPPDGGDVAAGDAVAADRKEP